ncbi:hypothetical protein [Roseovarius sp.]|uniref:hypothetical protein n=1 Tax=Roseovarius sp. TaxID=1486281 RepID=UPI003A97B4A6
MKNSASISTPAARREAGLPEHRATPGRGGKVGFVNIHLLVSLEDPDHLGDETVLKRLQFHAFNDRFDCTREELIKFGKRRPVDHRRRRGTPHGATQFKVNFDQLRKVIARANGRPGTSSSPLARPETARLAFDKPLTSRCGKKSRSSRTSSFEQSGTTRVLIG